MKSAEPRNEEVSVAGAAGTSSALAAIDFAVALRVVAGYAAGPLGAASVLRRRPRTDPTAIADDLATVDDVAAWLRRGGALGVEPVGDLGAILARLRITGSVLDGAELAALRATLTAVRRTHEELRRAAVEAPRLAALPSELPPRALERALETTVDDDGHVRDDASPALLRLRRRLRETRERLVGALERMLRELTPGEAPQTVTLRNGRYVIPVRRDAKTRVKGIVHDESSSGGTLFVEPGATVDLGNALRELEGDEAREIQRVLREITERIRPETETIEAAWRTAIAADDLVARARYAVAVDGHRPDTAPAPAPLAIVGGRHPLLDAPVPFDLSLTPRERTLLISGPNAGGKTVSMKAVGLIAALAQAGVIPPVGPGTRLPVFGGLFADIGDRQSIAESLSTFSAHVETLKDVLARADERSLVLLDEIGVGTDPAEGAALAAAVLLSLTARGALTLATTHLGQLKRLAESDPAIVNASLQFDTATLQPTYRLIKGLPGRSYGLAIARRHGLPEGVLREAEAAVPAGEKELDALLADVERRSEALAAREAAVTEQAAALGRREARLAERSRELEQARTSLAETERRVAREAKSATRRYLLDARKTVEEALALARQAVDETTAREARRLIEHAVQGSEPGPPPGAVPGAPVRTPPAKTPLAPGDRVRTPMGAVGVVTELRDDGQAVVEAGDLRLRVAVAALDVLPPAEPVERMRPVARYDESTAASAVDLRGLRADEAESTLVRAIDEAVRADLPELRVVHGKGTGALRARVRELAEGDPRIAGCAMALPEQGGSGVTLIRFRR